jgi:hypothetical protein
LKGLRGVLEIRDNHDSDTYRPVYAVHFEGVVYVLHAFQKKSTSGIAPRGLPRFADLFAVDLGADLLNLRTPPQLGVHRNQGMSVVFDLSVSSDCLTGMDGWEYRQYDQPR